MSVVFMNSLEKKAGEQQGIIGQVMIQKNEGMWEVVWTESDDIQQLKQDVWFTGSGWEELISVFRYRVAEKVTEGFIPLIDSMFDHPVSDSGKTRMTQMLQYYSETQKENDIYLKLRKWRNDLAAKEGIPPYLIASNRVLKMISVFLPYTTDELKQIPGFGEKKATVYGNDVIQWTKTIVRAHDFPLDWVPGTIDLDHFHQWLYRQKELKYKKRIEKEVLRNHLLESIQTGKDLDTIQSECSIPRRELVEWIEQLDKEGYDLTPIILRTLESVPEEEKHRAWLRIMRIQFRRSRNSEYTHPIFPFISIIEK